MATSNTKNSSKKSWPVLHRSEKKVDDDDDDDDDNKDEDVIL